MVAPLHFLVAIRTAANDRDADGTGRGDDKEVKKCFGRTR
jgi:hypothetical protein